jgi:hypothetical protein
VGLPGKTCRSGQSDHISLGLDATNTHVVSRKGGFR